MIQTWQTWDTYILWLGLFLWMLACFSAHQQTCKHFHKCDMNSHYLIPFCNYDWCSVSIVTVPIYQMHYWPFEFSSQLHWACSWQIKINHVINHTYTIIVYNRYLTQYKLFLVYRLIHHYSFLRESTSKKASIRHYISCLVWTTRSPSSVCKKFHIRLIDIIILAGILLILNTLPEVW